MSDESWWYVLSTTRLGPVSREQLVMLHVDGIVGLDNLVWTEGMKAWLPLGQVDALRNDLLESLRKAKPDTPPDLPADYVPKVALTARNASSPLKAVQDTSPLQDLTNSAFALRVTVLIFGYVALFGLVTDYFFVAIGQILGALITTTVLFLILWGGARIFGRRFYTPRRKAFELALAIFAFFVVTVIIDLRLTQIMG